jgi:hypothetical protein
MMPSRGKIFEQVSTGEWILASPIELQAELSMKIDWTKIEIATWQETVQGEAG